MLYWICTTKKNKKKLCKVLSRFYHRALNTLCQPPSLSECNLNHFLVISYFISPYMKQRPGLILQSLLDFAKIGLSLLLFFTYIRGDFLTTSEFWLLLFVLFLQVVVQLANSFNFYCSHQSFCHPFCYRRHMRACSRLMKSVRRVRLWILFPVFAKNAPY